MRALSCQRENQEEYQTSARADGATKLAVAIFHASGRITSMPFCVLNIDITGLFFQGFSYLE